MFGLGSVDPNVLLELFTIYRDWQEGKVQKISKRQVSLFFVMHFEEVLIMSFGITMHWNEQINIESYELLILIVPKMCSRSLFYCVPPLPLSLEVYKSAY